MIVLIAATTGAVVGFVWQKRRDRRRAREGEGEGEGEGRGASDGGEERGGAILLSNGRRAAVTSLMLLRTVTLHAFKRTAQDYAPVPLTFSAAVFSALPALFGTAFSVNFVLLNAVPLVGGLLAARGQTGAAAFADVHRGRGDVVRAVAAGGGVVGFVLAQRAWERSPLRGSLSVFGRDPHLDRCASAERYLAEKLVLLTYGGYQRITSLRQLARAARPRENGPLEAAEPLQTYARRALQASTGLLGHVDGVFTEYGDRYVAGHKEMSALADKLRYPEAMAKLEPLGNANNVLLAPLRTRQAAADVAAKLAELRAELGSQVHFGPVMAAVNFAAGTFLGIELAQLPLIRNL